MFDIQTNSRVFHHLTSSRAINVNNTFQIIFHLFFFCGYKDSWIPIYLHWWNYWAHWLKHFLVVFWRRSLGFIAASRVSYGPLTEYKAARAKNYNKNKQKMIFSICCKFANIWCNLKFSRWCAVASLCSNLKLCNCCRLLSAAGTNSQISTNIGFQSHLDQI